MTQQATTIGSPLPPAACGAALGVLTVLGWASYNVAAVHGIEAGLNAIDLTLLRFGTAGLILAPALLVLRWRDPCRGRWPGTGRALVLALLGGPLFGALAVGGYAFAPLSHGMVLAPAAVFVAGLALTVALNGERVASRRIAGGFVVVAGLTVLSGAADS
ncbi:MAG: EamA family transporter [Pseudomonadota bacterium]